VRSQHRDDHRIELMFDELMLSAFQIRSYIQPVNINVQMYVQIVIKNNDDNGNYHHRSTSN
jgi:hypothetical protein